MMCCDTVMEESNQTKNILIIGKNQKYTNEIKGVLEDKTYNFCEAFYFDDIEYCQTQEIDLVIFDLSIFDNQIAILKQYTGLLFKNKTIPLIVLVQDLTESFVDEIAFIGAVEILKKPYFKKELLMKVELLLNHSFQAERIGYQQLLLQQYKEAIDMSTIVSKTNPKGKITYVNDAFCKASGYSKDELLGKSHNIIRNPDTPKDVFKNLWFTIKNQKNTWSGVIKNRKKDGEAYYVKSFIIPILDNNGNITEYISIRTDITEQELIKQYFQKGFLDFSKNFSHAFQLQKEYENAIDHTNIVFKMDTNGEIKYVNMKFIEITGYTQEELIGKSSDIIRGDMPDELLDAIWKTIRNGETWEGINQNTKKDGSSFWTYTYVIPIKDENQVIVEYLNIKHDLTEVFTLNNEIDATQKEIIYKMGEIGESRSKETGNHVKRVAEYSRLLALLHGIDTKEADILLMASPMHDIGKVAIPDSILKKPGALNADEWKIMKTHASIGYNILKNSNREILKTAAIVANEHHEKWDGSGYPKGLRGEDIHIYGRITAIADVFDALGSDRCYKKAWDLEKILKLFEEEKGKHFDPNLIELFFDNLDRFLEIRDMFRDEF